MPIAEADILYKLSTKDGAAGNTTAQADPNASLGKYVSTTQVDLGDPVNNLWDDVTGDENAAEDVEYRCLFVHNSHATLTLQATKLWIASQVADGVNYDIGVDPTAASAVGASAAQAVEVADEQTAPAGVTFSAPASKAAGLDLGDIGPGQVRAFWFRRTATNSAAVNADGLDWRVEGDTAA